MQSVQYLSSIHVLLFWLNYGDCFTTNGKVSITAMGQKREVFYNKTSFPRMSEVFSNVDARQIIELKLINTNIKTISAIEMAKMTNLKSLTITGNKDLKEMPAFMFKAQSRLSTVFIERNGIEYISPDCFTGAFKKPSLLTTIDLRYNFIRIFPNFITNAPAVKKLVIDDNPITTISKTSIGNLTMLETLSATNCLIQHLDDGMFSGSKNLIHLDLSENRKLTDMGDNAFVGADRLTELMLRGTSLARLPSAGLSSLRYLDLTDSSDIHEIPNNIASAPILSKVDVSEERRYLCCAFDLKRAALLANAPRLPSTTNKCISTVLPTTKPVSMTTTQVSTSKAATTTSDPFGGFTFKMGNNRRRRSFDEGFFTFAPSNDTSTTNKPPTHHEFQTHSFLPGTVTVVPLICLDRNSTQNDSDLVQQIWSTVECLPAPDALRPCDDVMGNTFLTVASVIVSCLALLSNGIVFGVLLSSRRTFTVTKLLISNLAFADFCLGMYLFVLVCASLATHGKYYNFVRRWQFDGGCDVTGFLAIFSSQLSMLILLVITIERYLAIVYAMYLNRRLTFGKAKYLMLACWITSFVIAVLPFFGLNSYKEVAICLPFRSKTTADLVYLAILLLVNCVIFTIVILCYIRMYWVVRAPHITCGQRTRSDTAVAKRMAVLVATDFFCWSPIALFGLLAASGYGDALGLNVKSAKYLLVIFFPLNAICNPFLYAMSTKSFKRDFFGLMIKCGICEKTALKYRGSTFTRASNGHQRYYPSLGNRNSRALSETLTTDANRKESRSSLWALITSKKPSTESTNTVMSTLRTPQTANRLNSNNSNNGGPDDVFDFDAGKEVIVKFSDSPRHLSSASFKKGQITERASPKRPKPAKPELSPLKLGLRRSPEVDEGTSPENSSTPLSADERRHLFKTYTMSTDCSQVDYDINADKLASCRESPLLELE